MHLTFPVIIINFIIFPVATEVIPSNIGNVLQIIVGDINNKHIIMLM